ncbi:MAG: N-acetylmuramoyl-L-alanine amidase, partial [Opitutales bacterium]
MPLFKSVAGERISSLGVSPDWEELDRFQGQISREHFDLQLRTVYCPRESWWSPWIEMEEKQARIRKRAKSQDWYVLRFSDSDSNQTRESDTGSHKKLRVVLDPGHLGGNYSEMEGRHFAIGSDDPVKEGDLSLLVAKRAQDLLEEKGIEVFLTRSAKKPVTEKQADDFNLQAEQWFKDRFALDQHPPEGKEKEKLIRKRREMLFYRVSEIYARADLINQD